MLVKRLLLVVVAVIATVPFSVAAQTNKVPLTHESMWALKRVGAPAPSPDGKWVVFSLVEPAYDDKDQVSDLWIVPADGSAKPRRLTFSKGGESGVAWSPDSRRIVFSAKREGDEASQLYVLDVANGGRRRSDDGVGAAARPATPGVRARRGVDDRRGERVHEPDRAQRRAVSKRHRSSVTARSRTATEPSLPAMICTS